MQINHTLGFREAVLLKALIPISSRVGPNIRYPAGNVSRYPNIAIGKFFLYEKS